MDRIARYMEYFWLALAGISSIWSGWLIATEGWGARKHLLWFPLVCLAMFFYRRFMRRKMAEWAARRGQE